MSKLNKIISKIGVDKVAHFAVGAMIVTFVYIISTGIAEYSNGEKILQTSFVTLFVGALSAIKESNDDKFEWKDILASVLGGLLTVGIVAFTFIF